MSCGWVSSGFHSSLAQITLAKIVSVQVGRGRCPCGQGEMSGWAGGDVRVGRGRCLGGQGETSRWAGGNVRMGRGRHPGGQGETFGWAGAYVWVRRGRCPGRQGEMSMWAGADVRAGPETCGGLGPPLPGPFLPRSPIACLLQRMLRDLQQLVLLDWQRLWGRCAHSRHRLNNLRDYTRW